MKRAVFLDRDGTLIEEVGYLDRIDRVRFFPYSIDAVRLLNRAGFMVIVATNQAGIARGYFDEAFVEATHRSLAATLAAGGARVDAFYFCPHHPEGVCRVVHADVRVPQAAAGPASARRGRSSDRPSTLVCRRRPRARRRGGDDRRRARRARPHRIRRPGGALSPRRRGGHRQSHRRRFLDSQTTVTRRLPRNRRAAAESIVDPGRLLELVDEFAKARVAVFGDLIVDEFIYGELSRVSREAPVLILDYDSTDIVPGGAGNAANNVARSAARRRTIGVAGRDEAGTAAARRHAARRGRQGSGPARRLSHADQDAHPRRRRPLRQAAGRAHRSRHAAVVFGGRTADDRVAVAARLRPRRRAPRLRLRHGPRDAGGSSRARAASFAGGPGRRPPVLVDSRYALLGFRGMTACTPNESEVEASARHPHRREPAGFSRRRDASCLARTRGHAVLVTRGSRGMALFERDRPTIHIPIFGSDQIADVTGAGDTVIATMTLALAARRDLPRGGAPRQLRRRSRRHEARDRDRVRR